MTTRRTFEQYLGARQPRHAGLGRLPNDPHRWNSSAEIPELGTPSLFVVFGRVQARACMNGHLSCGVCCRPLIAPDRLPAPARCHRVPALQRALHAHDSAGPITAASWRPAMPAASHWHRRSCSRSHLGRVIISASAFNCFAIVPGSDVSAMRTAAYCRPRACSLRRWGCRPRCG